MMLKTKMLSKLGLIALTVALSVQSAFPQAISITPVTQLVKTDTKVGTGVEAVTGKSVTVHYTGWIYTYNPEKPDHKGMQFDSSLTNGRPFTFTLGAGRVIKGWDQGVVGMKVGGKRMLTIPADLAYGERGAGRGAIPKNAALVFDIELLDVKDAK